MQLNRNNFISFPIQSELGKPAIANGLRAALGAGLRTIVTVSSYTREEDFAGAALVVSSLGDPNDHSEILAAAAGITPSEYVRIDDVVALLTTPPPTLENT